MGRPSAGRSCVGRWNLTPPFNLWDEGTELN